MDIKRTAGELRRECFAHLRRRCGFTCEHELELVLKEHDQHTSEIPTPKCSRVFDITTAWIPAKIGVILSSV